MTYAHHQATLICAYAAKCRSEIRHEPIVHTHVRQDSVDSSLDLPSVPHGCVGTMKHESLGSTASHVACYCRSCSSTVPRLLSPLTLLWFSRISLQAPEMGDQQQVRSHFLVLCSSPSIRAMSFASCSFSSWSSRYQGRGPAAGAFAFISPLD